MKDSTKKKLIRGAALVALVPALAGCGNKAIFDTKYTFTKAIVVNEDNATIINVKSWQDYEDGEQLQIETTGGMIILTSAFDTKLIDERNSAYSAEDLAQALVGPDGEVSYFEGEFTRKLTN